MALRSGSGTPRKRLEKAPEQECSRVNRKDATHDRIRDNGSPISPRPYNQITNASHHAKSILRLDPKSQLLRLDPKSQLSVLLIFRRFERFELSVAVKRFERAQS